MGLYDHWPYTNFHELNLTWLLRRMEDLSNVVENFVTLNTIKYADPIQWNITTQYEPNTVVVDPQRGTAYISSKPVPAGVALTNTDYWSVIFTLDMLSANDNITFRDEGSNILSTFASIEGDWLLWNGDLYKVTQAINVNEAYVVGYNLTRYTVELFIRDYVADIIDMIGDLTDLNTTDRSSLVNALNEVLQTLNDTTGDLNDLDTTDKSNVVAAINEVVADIKAISEPISPYYRPEDYGAVINDNTVDCAPAIKAAILAANVTGGTVLLDNGIYYCQTPITIDEHLYNITIRGAGGSYLSQDSGALAKRGSSINYTGAGDFLHFSNGTWRCDFINFDIFSAGVGSALKFSHEDDPNNTARTTNCLIKNVTVSFTHVGIHVKNAAYLTMERVIVRHKSRNDDTINTDTNPVGFLFETENEYVTMRDCVSVPNQVNPFNSTSWSHGIKIGNLRHWIVSNLDITDCDCGITLEPSASTVGFIFIDSLDVARVHYGIHTITNVEPISNMVVEQLIYTAELNLSQDNRILKFEKTSGAAAYAVRGKFLNITPRTGQGQMTYWIEADDNALADGMCDFTFAVNQIPVLNLKNNLTCNENFATKTSLGAQTVDLNDYKISGMIPFIVGSASTNGPGYACMVVNFSCDTHTFQLALPLVASASNPVKYRYYQLSSDTWGSWRSITAT